MKTIPCVLDSNETRTNDNDGSDSDVQYLDEEESDYIDDKLTQKLRRLHLDDRVNTPNEDGRRRKNDFSHGL